MRYNLPSCMAKMGEIGRLITGSNTGSDREAALMGIERLEQLFAELGLNTRLRELVPDKSDLEHICTTATYDACHLTNPRPASAEDLMSICEEAW
jgi:alcohol dehydrogenase class IV